MALTSGQQRCVDILDRPLVVAAGAGSGKTYTLTQRIAGAFEDKSGQGPFITDIDEVCAITFTRKAAGELKSRIKAELRARGFVDQALRVDEAWISTIHGMCARILRAHALELGIDPAFQVAEGADLDELMSRAVDTVLAQAQAEDSPRLDALFAEYPARSYGGFGVSVEGMLSEMVAEAASQAAGADAFVLPNITMKPAFAVEQAIQVVEGVMQAAESEKESAKRNEWMGQTEQQLARGHGALERGISDCSSALRVLAPFKLAKTFGSKEYRARVDEARVAFSACIMNMRLGAARPHLETLVDLARQALDEFSALKRANGVLDNNDLLVLAARALEEHPAIAAQYADKFKLVMVDEFQDTDQMQVDMIKRLAGAGAQRLCTVGDAQQSIYRFRGADVSVYRRHLDSVRANWPDSIIELSDNFRSHADVLAFVDRVFEKPGMFGGEFMSLSAGRDESKVKAPFADGQTRIYVQHTTRPSRGSGGSARLVEESANRVAEQFAKLADQGHAPGDMAVLLGRMTNADVYARALRDHGLPCVVAGGSVFARTQEVQISREIVRVLANPFESQALFNVLTGPLFACTAGDLLAVGGMEGFWRAAYDESFEPSTPELACALRVLACARASIGRKPVSRIMRGVLADSGWLSRMQSNGPEGLARAANMLKAVRLVHSVEQSGATGPASVMRCFNDMLDGTKQAPGALSVSGGNSVRIMTVHASKGLEFPIVAVAEFKDDKPSLPRLLSESLSGRVYLSLDLGRTLDDVGDAVDANTLSALRDAELGNCATEDELARAVQSEDEDLRRRLAMRDYRAMGDSEEAKRLLYVALTRAREVLVVASVGTRTKDNPAGLPKNAFAGIFAAIDPTGEGFESGRSLFDFGGQAPAVLDCVALQAVADADADAAGSSAQQAECEPDLFMVPAGEASPALAFETYKPAHQDIFSYSSISDASHEGGVLDRLAGLFAVSVDDGLGNGSESFAGRALQQPVFGALDDDFWDYDPSAAFDEDRATDLGTAFHRLAQYAVATRGQDGSLTMPPAGRVEALSRTCNLGAEQRLRLDSALDRWFGCDIAREMAAMPDLAPEVPFFVAVPTGNGHAYLEGEIDLLGFDEGRKHAVVVDYKTGGRDDETPDELRCKHVLQATCYAYAVMLQGVESVEAVFVRVERPRADAPGQPQCVRYRFERADMPVLGDAIAETYGRL